MARKSAVDSEEAASPDNASAHSDVEMHDQHDEKRGGFNKFGVSASRHAPTPVLYQAEG